MRDYVCFYLNGEPHHVRGDDVFLSVTDYLRVRLAMMGTKVVCAEGDCGACTVLIGRCRGDAITYDPVDACIQFIFQIDGTHVVTVEGLADHDRLHPVQQALIDQHGSQCGYCTPGIVMALAGWAERGCPVEMASPRIALTGNLCRCTGYVPIFEAAEVVAKTSARRLLDRYDSQALHSVLRTRCGETLSVASATRTYFAPTTLSAAVAFKSQHPDAVIVAGGTELGVLRNKKGIEPAKLLSLARIRELAALVVNDREIIIGANTTWAEVETVVRDTLPAFLEIVQRFGSPQIRNVGTLVGNVANGSPIADSLGLLSVLDASIELVGSRGSRRRPLNGFYTGYKKKDMAADELIARVFVPLPHPAERLRLVKVSRRWDLDIATFGSAIRIREEGGMILDAKIALTGVAPTVVRLSETEASLRGQPFSEKTFRRAGRSARSEIRPLSDVRGSRDFRLQLAENVFLKFYHQEMADNQTAART